MEMFSQNQLPTCHDLSINKLYIMHDLEDTPEGMSVAKWPLHCTFIPPYQPSPRLEIGRIEECMQTTINHFQSIDVTPIGRTFFGPEENIEVEMLQGRSVNRFGEVAVTDALQTFRRILLLDLSIADTALSYRALNKHFAPHVTIPTGSTTIQPFSLDSLSIGATTKNGEKYITRVVHRTT